MDQWQELEAKYFMRTFSRVPLTFVRGQGTYLWDAAGKEYLDFVSGWAVDSLGHCHPAVVQAVQEQVATLIQTSNQYYTIPQVQLAELLVSSSSLDRVFFCNSGAEANEGAAKLARRYGERFLKGAYEIVTTTGSFHGRTLMMVAATGQQRHQALYAPLPNGFVNVTFNDIDAIRAATTERTCAVMLEPIQGEGGVNVPDAGYLKAVREWCDERGILLILDEIQTGIGRCGSLFAYQQFGVVPDIITLAKGIASGLPLGAFMATERASVFQPGEHGSTFGGNPVMCAAAYATLKFILDNGLVAQAAAMGERLTQGLLALKAKHPVVTDVRGRGLLIAAEFDREIGQTMLDGCLVAGLLVNRVKPNAIRLMPPLNVTPGEVDAALEILDRVLTEDRRMIGSRAFTGLGRGGRATLSALAFGLIFVSLVALARPAGALYRVTLNPSIDSSALPVAAAGDVPVVVLRDAQQLAREVYRDQSQAQAYAAQLLALYQATRGQQALLVFSPGGWGTKSVEHSQGWSSIVRGMDQVLGSAGSNWMVLNYRRTPHVWYAKIDEAFAQVRKYPRKAPDLARRLDFLTTHHPGLTVFLASESNGTMFNDRVMQMLNNRERVYNIATGPPFYYTMRHLEHTLVLSHNGEVPDAFSQGHFCTILRSNFMALFRLDGQDRPRGDVMGRIRAPGHYYGWDRPSVAADITGFVTGILAP